MADDIANNPAPVDTATPAPELAAQPDTEVIERSDEQPPEIEGQAAEDELEEIEVDGKRGKVSKALKDGYLRQADYTRKTQEAAERAKAIEAEKATLAEQAQTFQRHAKEVGRLYALNEQIEPYEKLDADAWQRFSVDRPGEASTAWIHYQKLRDQRDALVGELNAQEQKWQVESQRESAKRVEEGRKAIAAIPGWSQELDGKLKSHATTYGFTPEEWSGVSDPRAVRVLMDAYNWRQLQANQQRQTPSQPAPVAAPPQVGGQRTPGTDLRSLARSEDISAYARARNKQVNGARR
jgi:hypothetical protein